MTIAADARLSPEQRDAKLAEIKKREAEAAILRKAFNETFSSAAGKKVLRWIMDQSGYQKSDIVADPQNGEIMSQSTLYNIARRLFYLQIRSKIDHSILIPVEHERLEQDEVDNLI